MLTTLCSNCGKTSINANFCSYCGKKLSAEVRIRDSIITDSEIGGDAIVESSFVRNRRKSESFTCRVCGASLTKYSEICPYCATEVKSEEIKTTTSVSELTIKSEKAVEISKDALDVLVTSAIEVLPYETAGLLFGDKYPTMIKACQPIQVMEERDIDKVKPSLIAEDRIIEASRKLRGLSFLGGYHSHPYEDPRLLNFQIEIGTQLSDADKQFTLAKDYQLEIVVAFYPWENWNLPPLVKNWQEQEGVLISNKDINIGDSSGSLIRVACHFNNHSVINNVPLVIGSLKSEKCPRCGAYLKNGKCEYCGFEKGG